MRGDFQHSKESVSGSHTDAALTWEPPPDLEHMTLRSNIQMNATTDIRTLDDVVLIDVDRCSERLPSQESGDASKSLSKTSVEREIFQNQLSPRSSFGSNLMTDLEIKAIHSSSVLLPNASRHSP